MLSRRDLLKAAMASGIFIAAGGESWEGLSRILDESFIRLSPFDMQAMDCFKPGDIVLTGHLPKAEQKRLAFGAIRKLALEKQIPTLCFNHAISKEYLTLELLADAAKIPLSPDGLVIKPGREWGQLMASSKLLSESHLYLSDASLFEIPQIIGEIDEIKKLHGTGIQLVLIDNLELSRPGLAPEKPARILFRDLKKLAEDLTITVVAST